MSDVEHKAEEATPAAPPPQRIEQADHVALIAAQGRKLTAVQALEAAQLRAELAQRELAAAESERAAIAQLIREKYAVSDADQIAKDGTIWRAQG